MYWVMSLMVLFLALYFFFFKHDINSAIKSILFSQCRRKKEKLAREKICCFLKRPIFEKFIGGGQSLDVAILTF